MIYSAIITGFVWMIFAGGFGFSIGAMIGAVVNSKVGGDAFQARAAGLRPQPPTAFSQSSIDYRGEQG